jgi:YD repeat-containing protein
MADNTLRLPGAAQKLLVGLLLASACPAQSHVSYSYDAAGRLAQVDYGNGQTITYTYDKAGNLMNVQQTAASSQSSADRKKSGSKSPDKTGKQGAASARKKS